MSPAEPTLVPLHSAHRPQLEAFECRGFRQRWTSVAEELIRELLPDALDVGEATGVGAWNDARLIGIASWRSRLERDGFLRSVVVAVSPRCRHQGIARLMKLRMLDTARTMGATAIAYEVHWDNEPMINLNASLGASVLRIPGDLNYCQCVIPIHHPQ